MITGKSRESVPLSLKGVITGPAFMDFMTSWDSKKGHSHADQPHESAKAIQIVLACTLAQTDPTRHRFCRHQVCEWHKKLSVTSTFTTQSSWLEDTSYRNETICRSYRNANMHRNITSCSSAILTSSESFSENGSHAGQSIRDAGLVKTSGQRVHSSSWCLSCQSRYCLSLASLRTTRQTAKETTVITTMETRDMVLCWFEPVLSSNLLLKLEAHHKCCICRDWNNWWFQLFTCRQCPL